MYSNTSVASRQYWERFSYDHKCLSLLNPFKVTPNDAVVSSNSGSSWQNDVVPHIAQNQLNDVGGSGSNQGPQNEFHNMRTNPTEPEWHYCNALTIENKEYRGSILCYKDGSTEINIRGNVALYQSTNPKIYNSNVGNQLDTETIVKAASLCQAIKDLDIEMVKSLIRKGADPTKKIWCYAGQEQQDSPERITTLQSPYQLAQKLYKNIIVSSDLKKVSDIKTKQQEILKILRYGTVEWGNLEPLQISDETTKYTGTPNIYHSNLSESSSLLGADGDNSDYYNSPIPM